MEENSEQPISLTSQTVSTIVSSGIPEPIKVNLFKAIGQLCSAIIDIPISYLEGVSAERRAETQARIKIISTSAEQIASQMNVDPEYARVAVKKYGQKIIKEQINLDSVVKIAVDEIGKNSYQDSNNNQEIPEISTDWLNIFEQEASQKNSEEMRLLFGKILAGEILKPSSYSIRTIKVISQLDNQAANLFHTFCSLCVSLQVGNHLLDARVVSTSGNAASNSLQKYGLPFDSLNILQEYGLIISDYNSYMDYKLSIININNNTLTIPLKYQDKAYGLLPIEAKGSLAELRLNGVGLSHSGKELFNIVEKNLL